MASIPRELVDLIPVRFVETHGVVPLAREDGRLVVAHPAETSPQLLDELGTLLRSPIEGRVLPREELDRLVRENYGIGARAMQDLIAREVDGPRRQLDDGRDVAKVGTAELSSGAEEPAIVSFVNDVLRRSREEGATDVHVEPYEGRLRVRFRIDGLLHEIPVPAQMHRFHAAIVSRVKVMAGLDIAEHRLPQDGRIKARLGGDELDFRVSILPTQYGETIDIRVLSNASILRGLDALGFLPDELVVVEDLLQRPHGVVLVTGPTGSGKTTTLYSFLNVLNEAHRKILTIEDPIEYNLDGISQMQVHPRIGLTFARGLRSMLRHDPDVMMVGEIRDQETAETVIRVALTGHLVFSTIHTNDAPSTPARLLDMGVEPYLVASAVECILAQRLVRLLCPECARPHSVAPSAAAVGLAEDEFVALFPQPPRFLDPVGCPACRGTGYRGRNAIVEILPMSPAIQEAIQRRESAAALRRIALTEGHVPLRWRGLKLAAAGRTSVEEVLRVTASHR